MANEKELIKKELGYAHTRLDRTESLLFQMLVVVNTVISGIAILGFFGQSPTLVLLWVVPFLIQILFVIGIRLVYAWQGEVFFIRYMNREIQKYADYQGAPLFHDRNSFISRFMSFHTGNITNRFVWYALFLSPPVFYILMLIYSFILIYSHHHMAGILFLIFYSVSLLILLRFTIGAIYGFPRYYKRFLEVKDDTELINIVSESENNYSAFILPRPVDFYSKIIFFLLGVFAAYIQGQAIAISSWRDIVFSPYVPSAWVGTIIFIILWFVIQEGLIQQAKYIWNDIRDRKRDEILPVNKDRPVQTANADKTMILNMFFRLTVGLLFAYFLSIELLVICLYTIGFQAFYELYVKENSSRFPLLPLFVLATGSSLRFLGGSVSAGWAFGQNSLSIYFMVVYTIGISYLATFWKIEAVHLLKESISFQRGQSSYFLRKGHIWIVSSFITGILLCGLVLLDSYYNVSNTIIYSFSPLPFALTILILLIIGGGFSFVTFVFVSNINSKMIQPGKNKLYQLYRVLNEYPSTNKLSNFLKGHKVLSSVMLLLIILFIVVIFSDNAVYKTVINLWMILVSLDQFFLVMIFAILLFILFRTYSTISYYEYTFRYARRNFPEFKSIVFHYFFTADTPIRLKDMISLALAVNNQKFELILQDVGIEAM